MFKNLEILYYHGGIIVNIGNGITYNGGSHEYLIPTLEMPLNKNVMLSTWLEYI